MIDIKELCSRFVYHLPPGTMLSNLGGGTTIISGYSRGRVSYKRGNSTIRVKITDLFAAYAFFRGRRVSSRDLKMFAPHVYDSQARPAGHSCNCTFLFMVLLECSLAEPIEGKGRAYNPFFTTFR